MNTTNTFFNRDQSIAKVNMAMNYLSRLVRENMTIFDYDSYTGKTSFLTNSDKIVSCVITTEGSNVSLKNVVVADATDTFSNEKIDEGVDGFVSDFIHSLKGGEYGSAENGFSKLLGAFESRSKVNESRSKLERRRGHFTKSQEILSTPQYIKLSEIKDHLIEFLKVNKESLLEYEDVVNSVRLTNALAKAFNSQRKSWDDVVMEGKMVVPYDSKKTVYEMICTQELIRSELTESKDNFARSWVKNPKIASLASCLYNDDAKVSIALEEAIGAVPYLALASKADIKEVFASIYESSDVANISQKDIREYVARIFELKKPIKTRVIKELNESYGINVQNLKFVPSFANLSKAQSVMFEALSKIGEKETVVKDVLYEMSKVLRKKNGIEALDLNDFITEVFTSAGIFSETEFYRDVDLDAVVEAVLIDKKDGKKDKKDKKDKKGKPLGKDSEGEKGDPDVAKAVADEKDAKEGKPDFTSGASKGDDSKTKPGKKDFIGGEEGSEEEDAEPLGKAKLGKKKKPKKGGALSDDEADAAADQTAYDEAIEYAEPEEESDLGSGLSDEGMTELMGELETLFKEVDWSAIAEEEEETDTEGFDEDSDEMTERTPNEFSDEEVGAPAEDESP